MLEISEKNYWPMAERAVKSCARNLFADFFSEEDLNDITGDVVERMFRYRELYDETRGAVSTWVGRIARNAVLDAAGKEKRRRQLFSLSPLGEQMDEDGDVCNFVPPSKDETDDWLIARDTEQCLRESVQTERDSRLLNGLINGNSRNELAEMEGVKPSVIYTAIHHLRKRLNSVA